MEPLVRCGYLMKLLSEPESQNRLSGTADAGPAIARRWPKFIIPGLIAVGLIAIGFFYFLPTTERCGNSSVLETVRDLLLQNEAKAAPYITLLSILKPKPDVAGRRSPFSLDIENARELRFVDRIRRCAVDVRFSYDKEWLQQAIYGSALSDKEKHDFPMMAVVLGINLGVTSRPLNYTVQTTESGDSYITVSP